MRKTFYPLIMTILMLGTATAQESRLIPATDHAVYFDVSPPLRDMVKSAMVRADGSWKDGSWMDPFTAVVWKGVGATFECPALII